MVNDGPNPFREMERLRGKTVENATVLSLSLGRESPENTCSEFCHLYLTVHHSPYTFRGLCVDDTTDTSVYNSYWYL